MQAVQQGCSPGFRAGVWSTASASRTTGHRFWEQPALYPWDGLQPSCLGSSYASGTSRGPSADYRMEAMYQHWPLFGQCLSSCRTRLSPPPLNPTVR
ncbi:hypothetical protein NFI96_030828, partial [Prochilodus magdalenae]